jgi:hypothetical protein
MRKMSAREVKAVSNMLMKWRRAPLTWNKLKHQISITLLSGGESWSRQSLTSHDSIQRAWLNAKKRLKGTSGGTEDFDDLDSDEPSAVENLEAALADLQVKFDKLALRHRQLIYNASMLPGGTRLLLDPLPDNTPTQTEGTQSKTTRRS